MIRLYNRARILLFSYYRYLRKNRSEKRIGEENKADSILIVFLRSIGDSLIAQEALKELTDHYKEKSIYLLSLKFVNEFIKDFGDLEGCHYLSMDMKADMPRYREVRNIYLKIKDIYFDKVICLQQHSVATAFLAGVKYNDCLILSDNSKWYRKRNAMFLGNRIYTDVYESDKDDMFFKRYRDFVRYIEGNDYRSKIYRIDRAVDGDNRYKNKYVVISVGAQETCRRIPVKHIIQAAKSIRSVSVYEIVLTGEAKDRLYAEEITEAIKKTTDITVHNMVGNTSIRELFDVISGSQLVLSGDSGTAHMSVSLGKRVICISGFWDGNQFMPYDVDDTDGLNVPICIKTDENLPCDFCRPDMKGIKINPDCMKSVKSGGSYHCLNSISEDKVGRTIERLLSHQ